MGLRETTRAALRDEWDGLDRIWRDLRAADFATMANALIGMSAIIVAAQGDTALAIELVLLGLVVDGVDGFVARLGFGNGPLGATLDTLADTVTFGVAPAVIMVIGADVLWPWPLLAAGIYVTAVLLRLARFEAMRSTPRSYFSGLSSPGGALLVLAFKLAGFSDEAVAGVAVAAALLMVSRFRFPKLRGALGVLAAVVVLAVLVSTRVPQWQEVANVVMLAFMAIYVLTGPYYVLVRFGPIQEAK